MHLKEVAQVARQQQKDEVYDQEKTSENNHVETFFQNIPRVIVNSASIGQGARGAQVQKNAGLGKYRSKKMQIQENKRAATQPGQRQARN